ncbi:uncharacterized protein LOC141607116 [Silene latifolia]|uniref:uncharacterized protein LOC141607116 n=1 Tax=Silene latifolia TaxID=37657 RepID=UPI003D76CBF2
MQFYLLGQDLWSIVCGGETAKPARGEELKKWKVKAGKVIYVLTATVGGDMLYRIKDAETPKEAWNTLKELFSKKNDSQLQLLENELMSVRQNTMSVNEWFTKLKTLCEQITKLDPENPITDTRMRRIIIFGLRPGFMSTLIAAIRGWATQPTLIEFENIHTGGGKRNSESSSQGGSNRKSEGFRKGQGRGGFQRGGARQDRQPDQQRGQVRPNVVCYNCSKKGHYARDCWSKPAEGNVTTSNEHKNNEVEWDVQALYSVEQEGSSKKSIVHESMALVAESDNLINYKDNWIIDSGCSNHTTEDKEKFLSMSEYKRGRVVVTANNSELPITDIGKAMVIPRYSNKQVHLDNVYHV